jgi:hypothetical protein
MINQPLLLAFFCFLAGTLLAQSDQQSQKRDLEQLLSAAVPFAKQMLIKYGEFFPYSSSMNSDGKISAVGGYTGSERPKSTEVIDLLRAVFRREAEVGKIRACAVVYDIRTVPPGKTQKTDAIAVELDHRAGMSIVVVYGRHASIAFMSTRFARLLVAGHGMAYGRTFFVCSHGCTCSIRATLPSRFVEAVSKVVDGKSRPDVREHVLHRAAELNAENDEP